MDNVSSVDYFKQITLKQAASFEFDITLSGSARFVVLKRTSSRLDHDSPENIPVNKEVHQVN